MEEVLLFIPATSFFVSKGIFSATGRVRRGTYSNGGFLLVFTLLFGNLSALALTAFLSRAQERNAKHHHARREKAHERASTFAHATDQGRSAYVLPGLDDDDDDDDDDDEAAAPAAAVPTLGIAFEAAAPEPAPAPADDDGDDAAPPTVAIAFSQPPEDQAPTDDDWDRRESLHTELSGVLAKVEAEI